MAADMEFSLAIRAFLLVLIITVSTSIWQRYLTGLRRIPGPFLASVSSLWKLHMVWKEQMPWLNAALHEKYGPLVRIGPHHISASSPEALNMVHVRKKGFQKSSMYEILQPQFEGSPLHNVFSTQDVDYHSTLKRAIGNLYTMTAMSELEPNLDRSIQLLIERLGDFACGDRATVDMSAWLQFWAFDALGEVNFSRPIGFLKAGKDIDGICDLDHEMMLYYAIWGQIPSVEKIVSRFMKHRALKPNPLFNFTLDLVNDRLKNPTNSEDMLNAFLRVHNSDPKRLGLREVVGAAYINVVTAHDVLAITLRAILYYVYRNPVVRQKLTEEIRQAEVAGKLSRPAKYTETAALPYLTAVINEALRIHPSTGTILERYVPAEGVVLHGQFIPAGTTIGVNAWVMNRNKEVFGEDVEEFRPERWIDNPPEKVQGMKKNLLTWGAGSRGCIGKNMATMQIFKVIVELYRNFDMELANPEKEWHVSGGWLTRQTQMDMVLTQKLKT